MQQAKPINYLITAPPNMIPMVPETEPELSSRIAAPPNKSTMIPDNEPELNGLIAAASNSSTMNTFELTGEAAVGLPLPCMDINIINKDVGGDRPSLQTGKSANNDALTRPQSYFTLPGSEYLTEKRRTVAIFGPHYDACQKVLANGCSVILKRASTLEYFQEGLRDLKSGHHGMKPTELWLFHTFPTDREGRPLIGGQLVSENDLYEPLCDSEFTSISVYQFQFRLPDQWQQKPTQSYSAQMAGAVNKLTEKSISDINFFQFEIDGKESWQNVGSTMASVVALASTDEGLTAKLVSDDLIRRCSGLTLTQRSGIRNGKCISSMPELIESVEGQLQVCGIISRQPSQPDQGDLELDTDYSSTCRPRNETCNESLNYPFRAQLRRNASIGIIVGDYSNASKKRYGAERDKELIFDISRKFGCNMYEDDIYSKRGTVTKQGINNFIQERQMHWQELHNMFFFVSAHGDKNGIVTSWQETMSLTELVQPLRDICEHLVLIYQPCRGDVPLLTPGVPRLRGLSLPADDTAGCCLPQDMTNVSAMLASLPGFENSWHSENGSLMLQSLCQVVHAPDLAGKLLNIEGLTQLTAAKLCEMFPDYKDKVPMQYIMRGDCSIRIADTNFPLHNMPVIPDVRLQGFTIRL